MMSDDKGHYSFLRSDIPPQIVTEPKMLQSILFDQAGLIDVAHTLSTT